MVREDKAAPQAQDAPHLANGFAPSLLRIEEVQPVIRKHDGLEGAIGKAQRLGVAYLPGEVRVALTGSGDQGVADIYPDDVSTHLVEKVRCAARTAAKVQDTSTWRVIPKARLECEPFAMPQKVVPGFFRILGDQLRHLVELPWSHVESSLTERSKEHPEGNGDGRAALRHMSENGGTARGIADLSKLAQNFRLGTR
jgi:hypothetical protein